MSLRCFAFTTLLSLACVLCPSTLAQSQPQTTSAPSSRAVGEDSPNTAEAPGEDAREHGEAAEPVTAEESSATQATAAPETTAASTPEAPDSARADAERPQAELSAARTQTKMPSEKTSAPPPQAAPPGDAGAAIAIGLSVDAVFYGDAGYGFFANDDVTPRIGLFAAHDLLSLTPELILAGELGWGVESEGQSGLFGQDVESSLLAHTFHAAASLRYVLLPWLQPHARLAAGASYLEMKLREGVSEQDEDESVSPFVSLGAGVLLRTSTRSFENRRGQFASLSLGVLLEAGYALRGPVSFDLSRGTEGSQGIRLANASLGELSLSGPYVRTSLVVRF